MGELSSESVWVPISMKPIILIQRWFRNWLKRNELKRNLKSLVRRKAELERKIIIIQRAVRQYICWQAPRDFPVSCAPPPSVAGRCVGIAEIQALWRGYVVRKLRQSRQFKDAFNKVKSLSKNPCLHENKELTAAKNEAIHILQGSLITQHEPKVNYISMNTLNTRDA